MYALYALFVLSLKYLNYVLKITFTLYPDDALIRRFQDRHTPLVDVF